jgi:hypothetical protein
VVAHQPPALDTHLERVAVIRGHDEQRTLEQPRPPEAPQQLAELVVGVAHLEEVPEVVVIRQGRIVEAAQLVDAVDRILAERLSAAAGWEVDPRLVRHELVVEVEGRLGPPADRSQPPVEAGGAPAA